MWLLVGSAQSDLKCIGKVKKEGFETELQFRAAYVQVAGVETKRKVGVRSRLYMLYREWTIDDKD